MLGCGGAGSGGAMGGGAGAGGMPPGGNGGRGNYGPSSPPTGSLPPFYESLKGGNNLANFTNQYNSAQGNYYVRWRQVARTRSCRLWLRRVQLISLTVH